MNELSMFNPDPEQTALTKYLAVDGFPAMTFDRPGLMRLIDRIDHAPLFGHSFPFLFHLSDEIWGPGDLLAFAETYELKGVKCHIDSGGRGALSNLNTEDRKALGRRARDLCLHWHVEVSSTEHAELARAVMVASDIDATSIRCYPRYSGHVSEIALRVTEDLRQFRLTLDPGNRFRLTLEQHEDLKSGELIRIMEAVGDPGTSLLFDTGNMVNAGEQPIEALEIQSSWITEVHLKDIRMMEDRGGMAQLGCRSGTGDLPLPRLIAMLLMLGEEKPQVHAIALEEEVGYFAPAIRFSGELSDPVIPERKPSTSPRASGMLAGASRAIELKHAQDQVTCIRQILCHMRQLANMALDVNR